MPRDGIRWTTAIGARALTRVPVMVTGAHAQRMFDTAGIESCGTARIVTYPETACPTSRRHAMRRTITSI